MGPIQQRASLNRTRRGRASGVLGSEGSHFAPEGASEGHSEEGPGRQDDNNIFYRLSDYL